MRVRFLQDVVTQEVNPQSFKKDEIYPLGATSGRRWIRRGLAVEVSDEKPAKKAPAKKKDDQKEGPLPLTFKGATVACLASGPSLSIPDIEHCAANGARLLGCNEQCFLPLDVMYAPDFKWVSYWSSPPAHETKRIDWSHIRTRYCGQDRTAATYPGWTYMPAEKHAGEGLGISNGKVHTGGNAGFTMLNMAILMGAKRVLLLGYDMRIVRGKRHWFGSHPKGTTLDVNSEYSSWIPEFQNAARQLDRYGAEVINCTHGSAITCFPSMTVQKAI